MSKVSVQGKGAIWRYTIVDLICTFSYHLLLSPSKTDGSDALPLVAGIVYFSPIFAERVMSLHLVEPLDAATYMGQDMGMKPQDKKFWSAVYSFV